MVKPIIHCKGIVIYDAGWIRCIEYEPSRYPADSEFLIHMVDESILYINEELKDRLVDIFNLEEVTPRKIWKNHHPLKTPIPDGQSVVLSGSAEAINLDNLRVVKTGPLLGQTTINDGGHSKILSRYYGDVLSQLSEFIPVDC